MKLDVFIKGETIDLCIPTREFAFNSNWYSWFNNPLTTRFLEQGITPNTPEDQLKFFDAEKTNNSRLILIISDKSNYVGTVSLSFINHEKKRASVAIVIGEKLPRHEHSKCVALESIARIVEHGMLKMGLNRIDAGQHISLKDWQQKMELIGFKIESLEKNGFVKGNETADSIHIAILQEDYLTIKKKRGKYWDSASKMLARMSILPEESYGDKLGRFYADVREEYYNTIFNL
jgi:RimJ/RimL family protein N-acetyltransferase